MKKNKDIFIKEKQEKEMVHKTNHTHRIKKVDNKKKIIEIGLIIGLTIIVAILLGLTLMKKKNASIDKSKSEEFEKVKEEVKEEVKEVSKIKIVDVLSKTRPYAVSVNNTPVAVKVQEGLNKAYMIYEIPTEGFTSRLLAFFKDQKDLTVGTIRSARHNMIDYANESDAILVHYGASHYAQNEFSQHVITHLNGNSSFWRSAFWRSNPEKLASEHTAYTSMEKITDFSTKHNYRLVSNNSRDTILLNYSENEVLLDNFNNVKDANSVKLPYGNITTVFKYNKDTKEYTKYVNDKKIKDHKTKEIMTAKNIIIVKIGYSVLPGNKYWDLKNTGTGDGFFATNGKYVPIKWEKKDRNSRTKYTYLNGEEIEVNDGRTYIELFIKSRKITIK